MDICQGDTELDVEIEWPDCDLGYNDIEADVSSKLDQDTVLYLKKLLGVVECLLESDEVLFDVFQNEWCEPRVRSFKLIGKVLIQMIEDNPHYQLRHVQFGDSHPYVKSYHDAVEFFGLEQCSSLNAKDQVERLNAAVDMIRKTCNGPAMRQYMRKLENARNVRIKGAKKLVKGLREKYARLEVLRLDLSYRKGRYHRIDDFKLELNEVKQDWERFRKDLLGGNAIPGVVGYMSKLEYGLLSGFHFHVIVLCNGSKHREDITLAKMLGEHWRHKIVPAGAGRYYNCNRHKNNYRYLGIGTLNYYDDEKYSALVGLVVDYMVKADFVMAAEAPGERVWFRSTCKDSSSEKKMGRPRKL